MTNLHTCFLFQWFLHNPLQHEGGGVVVEGNGCYQIVLSHAGQLLVDQDSLATTSSTHKHYRTTIGQEKVKEVAETDCL